MGLNKNAAAGMDKITVKDLQAMAIVIKKPLTNMVNKSLSMGIFPNCLKDTIITPIYKSGSKTDCGNYRPISLLNSISKIFEKIINIRIRTFINKTIGFDNNQYGFIENSGTEAAISTTLDQIYEALDEGKLVAAVFVDLTKAFDVVNHEKLVHIIEDMGIRGVAKNLVKDYLTNRTHCTRINNILSDKLPIKIGVPQGSLLGPLLYLLYIMNISNCNISSKYNIYADDTNIVAKANTLSELETVLNNDLKVYSNWLNVNELIMNTKKTNYMIFRSRLKSCEEINVKVNNIPLSRTQNIKYLGVTIDETLKWDNHVKNIKNNILPIIMAIRRSGGVTKRVAKLIYNGYILSKIRYNITSWSHCSNFHQKQIGTIMNKALKILFKMDMRCSTRKVYNDTEELDINQLIYFEKCKYIHKIVNKQTKSNWMLHTRKEIHRYNTRNRFNLNVPIARTSTKHKSLKNSAIKLYNILPKYIKDCKNIDKFKFLLKRHIRNFRI